MPQRTHQYDKGRLIPIQKSKLTRRRAADSTTSTARRGNEVRLFFWIGIRRHFTCFPTYCPVGKMPTRLYKAAIHIHARYVRFESIIRAESGNRQNQRVGWVDKPNKSTSRLKRWVYQPNLRRCKMAFRVTFLAFHYTTKAV